MFLKKQLQYFDFAQIQSNFPKSDHFFPNSASILLKFRFNFAQITLQFYPNFAQIYPNLPNSNQF